MREVVDDGHPVELADQFLAARHAAKARQPRQNLPRGQAQGARRHEDAEGVARVDRTRLAGRAPCSGRGRGTRCRRRSRCHRRARWRRATRRRDSTPNVMPAPRYTATSRACGKSAGHHQRRVLRQQLHQAAERVLHVLEVAIDVRVVELDRGEQQRLRAVVEELGALVEERGVVLVALDDEELAVAELEVAAEVERLAADHETRVAPGLLEHPGEQRRRRGLPVRPRHDDRAQVAQEELRQGLRQRHVRQVAGQQRLPPPDCTRHLVAHHHQVGSTGEVLGPEPLLDGDAEPLEHRAHRRVDILVGPRHLVAALLEHPGERRHGDAADGNQVHVPGRTVAHGVRHAVVRRFRPRQCAACYRLPSSTPPPRAVCPPRRTAHRKASMM